MKLHIVHRTVYKYERPVFLEPHYLHFYPLSRPYLEVKKFDLQLSPEPVGLGHRIEAESNHEHQCWYDQKVQDLVIDVDLLVETVPFNPFNFFIDYKIQLTDIQSVYPVMTPYLAVVEPLTPEILNWVTTLKDESGNDWITLLTHFNTEISTHWSHKARYTQDLLSVEDCFTSKEGSCRDLSWLFIQSLRALNIPARFVSGYAYNDMLGEGHELHAWIEAWLPGAGWLALDPSAGIFCHESYVPISVSATPQSAAPVVGAYRGSSASQLFTEVKIKAE